MNPTGPQLIVNLAKASANIKAMANKCAANNAALWPHYKTHQLSVIDDLFRANSDVARICVSSVSMARYFANHGATHIHFSFPLYPQVLEELKSFSAHVKFSGNLSSTDLLPWLKTYAFPIEILLEIDNGYGRCGFKPDFNLLQHVINELVSNTNIQFGGFYCHNGSSYESENQGETKAHFESVSVLFKSLRAHFEDQFPGVHYVYGDTPSCSLATDFSAFTAISAGNFVFYDLMQYHFGACSLDQIAVCMACPVVAKFADRAEVLIHGGAVHFNKDYLIDSKGKYYGLAVPLNGNDWMPDSWKIPLRKISQEHGILDLAANPELINHLEIGGTVGILPVHSCHTVNNMNKELLKNCLIFSTS